MCVYVFACVFVSVYMYIRMYNFGKPGEELLTKGEGEHPVNPPNSWASDVCHVSEQFLVCGQTMLI